MAHLTTINADGSPQVTVVWIGLDGDDLVSGHMSWYAKLRNIDRDPRVVLSFDAPRVPGVFLNEYAVLRARAAVQPSDEAWDLLNRLTKVYLSPDTEFPAPKGPRLYRALRRRAHRRRRPLGVGLALSLLVAGPRPARDLAKRVQLVVGGRV
jgi:PPOX class probable F420-dependent enzyme